jgi:hypothetical protein
MLRARWAVLGLILPLLGGCSRDDRGAGEAEGSPLQGTWEIVSVQRNGKADPSTIGAHLIFTGDRVQFALGKMKPKEVDPRVYLS